MASREADALTRRLRRGGVNTSVSFRGVGADGDSGTAPARRLSPHYYNTSDELDAAADALAVLARGG